MACFAESQPTVRDGSMPPWQYTLTHPDARLSGADLAALERGLAASLGDDRSDDSDDDRSDDQVSTD